ncbi:hypothetical protein [Ramlibacter sp.]|uniref:hypothetical protein n=1 Tax=Ramlibacter sp. TaxID=1917967 RepID=UPI002D111D92|nr:hypothetical protein [Ramlibacter sp.]HWI83314.1 hypothetical protein [Ramlibacter sp.]
MGAVKFAIPERDLQELRFEFEDQGAAGERHWGEGAGSALQLLHRQQQWRELTAPAA